MLFNKDYGILIVANSKVDVGNYNKSILDALEGIIYKNDRQVKISISIQENKLNKDTFIIGILPFENNLYDNYFIIDKLVKTLYDKILI
jgi:Holliday junction resolvase RusA-like endonuclease